MNPFSHYVYTLTDGQPVTPQPADGTAPNNNPSPNNVNATFRDDEENQFLATRARAQSPSDLPANALKGQPGGDTERPKVDRRETNVISDLNKLV